MEALSLYSSHSAYKQLFVARIKFEGATTIWKSFNPPQCKYFTWLVLHSCCWTADRLHQRGTTSSWNCLFCNQEVKTIAHLVVQCPESGQALVGNLDYLANAAGHPVQHSHFGSWWFNARKGLAKTQHRGFNTIMILVAWCYGRSGTIVS
uniref:Reverse transcriptase zinc-binding domain-containing protein n=1 Tax=Oryza brachyantha TaxID=4533 RepID=J3N4Z7_ORYBR